VTSRFDKLSVSMPSDIAERVRRVGFHHRLSESSIVEAALTALRSKGEDERVIHILRRHGASLRRKLVSTPASGKRKRAAPPGRLSKMSMNVSRDLSARLRRLAFDARLSESSIVEVALRTFLAQSDDDQKIGDLLRRHGATLRRR